MQVVEGETIARDVVVAQPAAEHNQTQEATPYSTATHIVLPGIMAATRALHQRWAIRLELPSKT
eukprot:5686050-Ditylum_brightwellii.AAC.1